MVGKHNRDGWQGASMVAESAGRGALSIEGTTEGVGQRCALLIEGTTEEGLANAMHLDQRHNRRGLAKTDQRTTEVVGQTRCVFDQGHNRRGWPALCVFDQGPTEGVGQRDAS